MNTETDRLEYNGTLGTYEFRGSQAIEAKILQSKVQSIIGNIVMKCIQNKIDVRLSKDDAILYEEDGSYCAGYFAGYYEKPEKNMLAFATGKPLNEWLPIALHESCHMEQFLEKSEYWTNTMMDNGKDATDILFSWINGEEITYDVTDIAMRALYVELDCERRTLEKIISYGLQDIIEPIEYTKRSNAYVYFYLYIVESRKWCERGRAPYSLDAIWTQAPDTFDNDYNVIPPKLLKAFREHLHPVQEIVDN